MIELVEISKSFQGDPEPIFALKDVNLSIEKGAHIAIIGRSGSGKSTLLNIMCALTPPTSGAYIFDGKEIQTQKVNDQETVSLRRKIGFINQASDLFNNLSVKDNIKLAGKVRGLDLSDKIVCEWLNKVGLSNKAECKPTELSGGQRQRVNIVRALACEPAVLFADEPTGALDVHTADQVIALLLEMNKVVGSTLVMVTHSPEAAAQCDIQLCIRDGELVETLYKASVQEISDFLHKEASCS
jgi:putative ABC transport system ATP-binding protein